MKTYDTTCGDERNAGARGLLLMLIILLLGAIPEGSALAQKGPAPQTGEGRTLLLYRIRTITNKLPDLRTYAQSLEGTEAAAKPQGVVKEIKGILVSLRSDMKRAGLAPQVETDLKREATDAQQALERLLRASNKGHADAALDGLTRTLEEMSRMVGG